jgi:molybdopterin/thiamine biosynthesis adenylyltransferase
MNQEAEFRERYDRSIRLFTEEGQRQLKNTSVAVVGCGGVGSLLATQLARLGVSEFVLIDPDRVERSNLNRLEGATEGDVGDSKVAVMQLAVISSNPEADVTLVRRPVEDALDYLESVDVIFGGVDSLSTRVFLNDYAVENETIYIDAGSRINTEDGTLEAIEGYVQYINPGVTACFECLDRADPEQLRIEELSQEELEEEVERGYLDSDVLDPEPAVIYLNGVVASLAVSIFTRHVLDRTPLPGLIRYDDEETGLDALFTTPSEHCLVCGNTEPELDLEL